ncbi:Transmembrane amino acid transporter protein [Trichomonas vaginalis G3]|uniref:Transmembrane amino acid transporter protein n=1 Tax=Trichomonas vaginalis (strain ATCC PRA-98 / G3) TaxID=412133 RepID=A2FB61_TRIV3|nr:Transmembrane amino acid transporter protein [Trichomonas vaginalis G3]|eukprot:XP_001310772.1 Transmembrane amino acid transporter protein [Trichomonas vaginalis G3]
MKTIMRRPSEVTNVELEDFEHNSDSEHSDVDHYALDLSGEIRAGRFETFVNLTNAIVSASFVNVPITFVATGFGPTFISMVIICLLSWVSGNILIYLESELHVNNLTNLTHIVFGKVGEIIIDILNVIFTFSCTGSYLIIGSDRVESWAKVLGLKIKNRWYKSLIAGIYSLILPVLLSYPLFIQNFAYIAYLITLLIITYTLMISGWSIKQIFILDKLSPTAKGYTYSNRMFTAISIHVSTFALPIMMIPIIKTYNRNVEKRKSIAGMTYVFTFILVTLSSCLCYLVAGESTHPDVLTSFDPKDAVIISSQVIMFLVVTLTYPFVTRSITEFFSFKFSGESRYEKLSFRKRILYASVSNIINVLLCVFISDSSILYGFGGAIPGCLMCFSFPSICCLKITKKKLYSWENIGHIVMATFGILMGITCTCFTIYDLYSTFNTKKTS